MRINLNLLPSSLFSLLSGNRSKASIILMSQLVELRLKGIRAFHPDPPDVERSRIRFDGPVTLITGENGSGKTTIIEALKYATMGQCSRNSKLQEFVNNPKGPKGGSVNAQIELDFDSVDHQLITVSRGAKLTTSDKKKTGMTFKASDCKIQVHDGDDVQTRNMGINEANLEIPALMGVSPAILENVIFCHQEDSCWPIDCNNRELKERFDLIFGAERYDKAMKALNDVLKELKQKKMEFEKEVAVQNEKLEQRLRIDKQIRELRQEEREMAATVNDLEPVLYDINERVAQYESAKGKIEKLAGEIETKKQLAEFQKKEMDKIFQLIGVTVQYDLQESRDMLSRAEDDERSFRESFEMDERTMDQKMKERDEAQKALQNLIQERTKKQSECDGAEVQRKILVQTLDTFLSEYGSDDYVKVLAELERKCVECKEAVANLTKKKQEQETEMNIGIRAVEKELSHESVELSKLESSSHTEQVKYSKVEHVAIEDVTACEERVENLENQVRELETGERNERVIQAEMDHIEEQRPAIQKRVQELKDQQQRSSEQSELQQKFENLEYRLLRAKKQKDEQMSRITAVVGDVECESVRDLHQEQLVTETKKLKDARERQKSIDNELSRTSASLEKEQSDLEKRKIQSKKAKKKFEPVLFGDDFQKVFETKNEDLAECTEKLARLSDSQSLYVDFRQKGERDHQCPLCRHKFDDDEVKSFCESVDEYVKNLPMKIQKCQQKKDRLQKEVAQLHDIRPHYELFKKNEELDQIAVQTISELTGKVESLKKQQEEMERVLEESEKRLKAIQSLSATVELLEGSLAEIETVLTEQKIVKAKMDPTLPSLAEVTEKLKIAGEESDKLMTRKHELTSELFTYNQKMAELRTKLADAKRSESETKEKYGEKMTIRGKLDKLTSEIEHQKEKVDELKAKQTQLINQRDTATQEYSSQMTKMNNSINESHQACNNCKSLCETIENAKSQISEVDSGVVTQQLEELEKKIEERRTSVETLDEVITRLRRKRERQKADIDQATQDIKKWKLIVEWNEKLVVHRGLVAEKELLEKKLRALLDAETGGISDYNELKRLQKEKDTEFVKAKTQLDSKKEEIQGRIREYERYRDTPKQMTEAALNLQATIMSCRDTERYMKALDESLLEYHSNKMQEINQTIHQLWQTIYRGNDIDSISIRAEKGATQKTSYNYRVIMRRDGQDLDMSHRSSAGQKMIASLVIRLALAETFSINCGIIALDEPTTNLDQYNVDNLSKAINSLIEKRGTHGSRPFQLIVISHNNYFVNLLMRGGSVDHFYQVRRDTDGINHYSGIHRCLPSDLQLEGGD